MKKILVILILIIMLFGSLIYYFTYTNNKIDDEIKSTEIKIENTKESIRFESENRKVSEDIKGETEKQIAEWLSKSINIKENISSQQETLELLIKSNQLLEDELIMLKGLDNKNLRLKGELFSEIDSEVVYKDMVAKWELLEDYNIDGLDRRYCLNKILEAIEIDYDMSADYGPMATNDSISYDDPALKDFYPLMDYNYEELIRRINNVYTNEMTAHFLEKCISYDTPKRGKYFYYEGEVLAMWGGMGNSDPAEAYPENIIIKLDVYNEATQSATFDVYYPMVLYNPYDDNVEESFEIHFNEVKVEFIFEDNTWKINTDISSLKPY